MVLVAALLVVGLAIRCLAAALLIVIFAIRRLAVAIHAGCLVVLDETARPRGDSRHHPGRGPDNRCNPHQQRAPRDISLAHWRGYALLDETGIGQKIKCGKDLLHIHDPFIGLAGGLSQGFNVARAVTKIPDEFGQRIENELAASIDYLKSQKTIGAAYHLIVANRLRLHNQPPSSCAVLAAQLSTRRPRPNCTLSWTPCSRVTQRQR